jgi:hypothetical protein
MLPRRYPDRERRRLGTRFGIADHRLAQPLCRRPRPPRRGRLRGVSHRAEEAQHCPRLPLLATLAGPAPDEGSGDHGVPALSHAGISVPGRRRGGLRPWRRRPERGETAANVGVRPCPFGAEQHPYLPPRLLDDCTLQLEAGRRIVTGEQHRLPDRHRRPSPAPPTASPRPGCPGASAWASPSPMWRVMWTAGPGGPASHE